MNKLNILLIGTKEKNELNKTAPFIVIDAIYNYLSKEGNVDIAPSCFKFNYNYLKRILILLYRALFIKKYSILHFNNAPLIYSPNILFSFLKIKKVLNLHGLAYLEKKDYKENRLTYFIKDLSTKWLIKRADVIIVNSNFSYKRLINHYHADKTKLIVISNGFSLRKPTSHIKLRGYPALLFVGVISKHKGIDLLIKSLPKLKEKFPEIHLHVIGKFINSELAQELRSYISSHHLSDYISFYGELPYNQISNYYFNTDICVFPSRLDAFGMVNLEAMSAKRPVIVSLNSGISELLQNKNQAILIHPSSNEIIKAILFLKSHPSLCNSIAIRGNKFANNYTWKKISETYLQVFNNLLK